jgi:hypothetical protein
MVGLSSLENELCLMGLGSQVLSLKKNQADQKKKNGQEGKGERALPRYDALNENKTGIPVMKQGDVV